MIPTRFQLSRKRGYRKPPNGVSVARPTAFGNPYPVAVYGRVLAVKLFRLWLTYHPEMVAAAKPVLRGRDLGCWCALNQPCHSDVWLELVNDNDTGS